MPVVFKGTTTLKQVPGIRNAMNILKTERITKDIDIDWVGQQPTMGELNLHSKSKFISINDYRRQKATGMKWKLRYLMDEAKDDMQRLADYLGISYQTLSKKLNNHVDFSLTELRLIQQRYDLKAEQIFDIFFK